MPRRRRPSVLAVARCYASGVEGLLEKRANKNIFDDEAIDGFILWLFKVLVCLAIARDASARLAAASLAYLLRFYLDMPLRNVETRSGISEQKMLIPYSRKIRFPSLVVSRKNQPEIKLVFFYELESG